MLGLCPKAGIQERIPLMNITKNKFLSSELLQSDMKITNKVKYTILQMCCAFVHLMLIFIFAAFGVYPMVIFNIFSTICYLSCGILVKKELYIPLYYITFVEISLHSYIATILVGWETGFPMYIIGITPIIFYMHFSLSENSTLYETLLIGLCSLATFVSCKFISYKTEPLYTIPDEPSFWIYIFNSLCTFAMLVLFSLIFLREIKSAHTKLENQNAQLDRIAGIDALTGLYNRRSMDKFLAAAMSCPNDFSIIMCDIDDFKKVNDTYGHKNGDKVLQAISKIIVSSLREDDFVCRWGGEEILILISGTALNPAAMAAERIRSQVEKMSVDSDGQAIKCTLTIGVAERSEGKSTDDIIALADERLYKGKRSGKNRVVGS